jgi:hypothetical protein
MITNLFINFVVLMLGAVFSWLPPVDKLPSIHGYDLDTALVNGMGMLHTFFVAFWPIGYMFDGFMALMVYFALKMAIVFVLGHRAPGQK